MRWLASMAAILIVLLAAPASAQDARTLCANPRAAADSLFHWQHPDRFDLDKASACLDAPPGTRPQQLAVQLRQVLDARGIYVPVSKLSTDPDYEEDGEHRVVPLPDDFPVLVLVRGEDGLWRYSRDTLAEVPALYRATFSAVSLWFQRNLPDSFYRQVLGLYLWQYLYAALLLLASWLIGHVVRLLLRGQVRRAVARLGLKLDDEAYRKTSMPIVVLVMVGVVAWGLTDLQLPIRVSAPLHRVLEVALWVAAVVTVSRFVNLGAGVAQDWAAKSESKLDDQLIPLLRQATQILVAVIGGLYIADAVGIDVWKLAAGVGIGGLAFALAAQDTVANVFGSVNIFVDRPFQIGDWVIIGDVEGVVEEVGFRSTRVRTFYNSVVTIPNSQITNANVDNMGLRNRRRIKLVIGLTYDTPPDKVQAYVEGVRAILAAHPNVQRTYEVHLYNFGASAIEILVYYHVVVPGWHEELVTRSQNLLEFMRLAERLGVSFAFPSTSVYIESTPEHPLPHKPTPPIDELQRIVDDFGPGGALARPDGPPFSRGWSVQDRDAHEDRGSA